MHENEILKIVEKLQDDVSAAEDAVNLTFEHLYADLANAKELVLKRIQEQDAWANREEARLSTHSAFDIPIPSKSEDLLGLVKDMADAMIKVQRLQARVADNGAGKAKEPEIGK